MATYALESVSWRRPGVLDVVIQSLWDPDVGYPAEPDPGAHLGGYSGQLVRKRVEHFGAYNRTTWLFRAGRLMPSGGGGDGSGGSGVTEFWTMDVGVMQAPLTSHPDLTTILSAGGGTVNSSNGEIDWPEYINGVKNSWYGTRAFLVPTVNLTMETIKTGGGNQERLSFSEIDNVGFSVSQAGDFFSPSAGSGRKPWLLTAHTLRSSGNEFRETKRWMYGGVLGWLDLIYDSPTAKAAN